MVISRVISRVTILVTHIRGHITPLITTPEPPVCATKAKPTPHKFVFFRPLYHHGTPKLQPTGPCKKNVPNPILARNNIAPSSSVSL